MSNYWRHPEAVLPVTTALFFALVWPLYSWTRASFSEHFNRDASYYWWILTALYFGFFVWAELIVLGCRLRDFFPALSALLFGMLASAALALREPGIAPDLEKIGFRHGFLFVLIPVLLLHIIVGVALVHRAKPKISSESLDTLSSESARQD